MNRQETAFGNGFKGLIALVVLDERPLTYRAFSGGNFSGTARDLCAFGRRPTRIRVRDTKVVAGKATDEIICLVPLNGVECN
jgi:hypothetical protein